MAHGIFNSDIFNNSIFNTHAGNAPGAGSNSMASVQPMQIVKPWPKDRKVTERTTFELILFSRPVLTTAFTREFTSIPHLVQYKSRRWKTFWVRPFAISSLKPIQARTFTVTDFDPIRPHGKAFKKTAFKAKYLLYNGVAFSNFRKTLYAKTHHGINLMRMALKLGEDDEPV